MLSSQRDVLATGVNRDSKLSGNEVTADDVQSFFSDDKIASFAAERALGPARAGIFFLPNFFLPVAAANRGLVIRSSFSCLRVTEAGFRIF
jgi:hypothetical protein